MSLERLQALQGSLAEATQRAKELQDSRVKIETVIDTLQRDLERNQGHWDDTMADLERKCAEIEQIKLLIEKEKESLK